MPSNDERDRGFLTAADRAYLRGEADLGSVQAERNARARVRNRLYDAILDFEHLVEHLDERDLDLVFEKRVEDGGEEAFDGLVSAIALLYWGIDRTDLRFEDVLREGVNLAEVTNERAATVDLDLTFHALDPDRLRKKLESEEELSLTEIAYLYESDEVSRDELAAYFADREDIDDGRVQSAVTSF